MNMGLFMHRFISLGVLLSSPITVIEAAPPGCLVNKLPGFNGTFPSRHYSGYVTIGGRPAKNLFYYFVVSERNASSDPVVLWLNGGPGCSSFDGFVYEHGPFNFIAGAKGGLPSLVLNPYSWSKVSNIIYLDSPAGVGFSYSENTRRYHTGDIQTAKDAHNFLLMWFTQFPEFLTNPFYISGESYAGIYVPTLASEVVKGIKIGSKPIINFKGYMVGNGVTDPKFDGNALVPFAHGMGLIPDDIFEDAKASCKMNYYDNKDKTCLAILDKVNSIISGLNIYNILEPCYHSSNKSGDAKLPLSFKQLGEKSEKPLGVRKRIFGRAWPFKANVEPGIVPSWPQILNTSKLRVPCVNLEVATTWLNNAGVRKAIHVKDGYGSWEVCTDKLSYNQDSGSMIDYHRTLTGQGYRVLIFSGDHDMCVPFTGSEAWTRSLGYRTVDAWRPWESNGQVAGFTQEYGHHLTFLTIKGAGHTVAEYKPRESLEFYRRWLDGAQI